MTKHKRTTQTKKRTEQGARKAQYRVALLNEYGHETHRFQEALRSGQTIAIGHAQLGHAVERRTLDADFGGLAVRRTRL